MELFDQIIEAYGRGDVLLALQKVFPYPAFCYDQLHSNEKGFRFLINYLDACVFHGVSDARETNSILSLSIELDDQLKVLAQDFLEVLKYEKMFMECYLFTEQEWRDENIQRADLQIFFRLLHQSSITEEEQEDFLQLIPEFYREIMRARIDVWRRWHVFESAKPSFSSLILNSKKLTDLLPWHQLNYQEPLEIVPCEKGKIPLIFLEPSHTIDYTALLDSYQNQPIVFVLETCTSLFQYLQFEALAKIFQSPQVFFYILELYPNEQLHTQSELMLVHGQLFQPVLLGKSSYPQDAVNLFSQVFQQCLCQPVNYLDHDSPASNWLYHLAKKLLFHKQAQRYGKSRLIALRMIKDYENWFDSHKGKPPRNALIKPSDDPFHSLVKECSQKRQPRVFAPFHKIRLVHVVPQIVDGGHAPSRLLRTILANSDRTWFELFVISTERLVNRPLSYPILHYLSSSSKERGLQSINDWRKKGIHVFVEEQNITYEQTIQNLTQALHDLKIDIAVFHGPDDINNLCSCQTDVPLRILFEHGTLPSYPCFDLAILSTEDSYRVHQQELREIGIESCPLPFSLDVRQSWTPEPYSRAELNLPENAFIMTTISNHLPSRLSTEMCEAIGEILQKCPNAFYAPIGPIQNKEKFRKIFDRYGVNERVKFMGHLKDPSQYARSMQLYLNEFPFGSSLGMLDAMAAGCPVVSMNDEHGPQQAQYGATFFGKERVIHSGRKEDYVALACRLIKDRHFYQEWSNHARSQYNKRVNMESYVKNFEKILEHFIKYQMQSQQKIE